MSEDSVRTEGSSPARAGEAARQLIRRTHQVTRRKFPAEEKIRIVLEGIRGEVAVSELCRREGIHPTIYYKWLKDFREAGKGRLRGDTKRQATSEEVRQVREENERLKQLVAEQALDIRAFKGGVGKKVLTPTASRQAVGVMKQVYRRGGRRAC